MYFASNDVYLLIFDHTTKGRLRLVDFQHRFCDFLVLEAKLINISSRILIAADTSNKKTPINPSDTKASTSKASSFELQTMRCDALGGPILGKVLLYFRVGQATKMINAVI